MVQVKLRYGDAEVRLSENWADPFALYPGESLVGDVKELEVIPVNTAIHLQVSTQLATTAPPLIATGGSDASPLSSAHATGSYLRRS